MAVQLGRDRTDGLVYEDVHVGVGKPGTAAAHRPTDRPPAGRQDAGAAREHGANELAPADCRHARKERLAVTREPSVMVGWGHYRCWLRCQAVLSCLLR